MQYERVTWRVAAAVLLALCIPAGAQTTQDVIPITADDDVYAVLSAATGTEHFMLDGPEGPAAHDDPDDVVTYTLSDTLVVTADMSPLTIEGSPVTSSGTRDLVWPHQVILEGPEGFPVIELEEGAELTLIGLTITGGTTGVSAVAGATVHIERCYIRDLDAEGLYLVGVDDGSTVKSSAIVHNGGAGIYVATDAEGAGGGVTIFQNTILDNCGPGVHAAADAAPLVSANIVYNNAIGLKSDNESMDAQFNWVFMNRCSGCPGITGRFPVTTDQVVETTLPVDAGGIGCASYILDGSTLYLEIDHSLVNAAEAFLMQGATGEVGTPIQAFTHVDSPMTGTFSLDDDQLTAYEDGELYVLITSSTSPQGHLRGQILDGDCDVVSRRFPLEPEQVPDTDGDPDTGPDAGAGCGAATLFSSENTLTVRVEHNLTGPVEATLMRDGEALPVGTFASATSPIVGTFTVDDDEADAFSNDEFYVLVTSTDWPDGHIQGQVLNETCTVDYVPFALDASQVVTVPSDSDAVGCGHWYQVHDEVTIALDHDVADPVSITIGAAARGDAEVTDPLQLVTFTDANAFPLAETFELTRFTDLLVGALRPDNFYVLVSGTARPEGDIRGQVDAVAPTCNATVWSFPLDADQVVEATSDSTASGCARLFLNETIAGTGGRATITLDHDVVDPVAIELREAASGAVGPLVAAFANPTAPAPLREQFVLDSVQVNALKDGDYYLRVTSAVRPTGVIRGQVVDDACDGYRFGAEGEGEGEDEVLTEADFCDYDPDPRVDDPAGVVWWSCAVEPETETILAEEWDPEDFFLDIGTWRGDFAGDEDGDEKFAAENTCGDDGDPVIYEDHPAVVFDFEYEGRAADALLEVGADEFNGIFGACQWTYCFITMDAVEVTIFVEVSPLASLEAASLILDPQLNPLPALIDAGAPGYEWARWTVEWDPGAPWRGRVIIPIDELVDAGVADGPMLVYLDMAYPDCLGIYGGPLGDYIDATLVLPTLEERTFLLDSLSPRARVDGSGRAHEYLFTNDTAVYNPRAGCGPYPTAWGAQALPPVPSSFGTLYDDYRDPQAFVNVGGNLGAADTLDLTLDVWFYDPFPASGAQPSGFMSNVDLAEAGWDVRVAPPANAAEILYGLFDDGVGNAEAPGTVWLRRDTESAELLSAEEVRVQLSTATTVDEEGNAVPGIHATWTFTGLSFSDDWHVVFNLRGMDQAGNRLENPRPLHVWWSDAAQAVVTSAPIGEVADPAIAWDIDRAGDAPDDPDPCYPIARIWLYRVNGDGSLTALLPPTDTIWTSDRTITRATVITDTGATLGQVLDAFAKDGDTIRAVLIGADEAGNVQDCLTVDLTWDGWPTWEHVGAGGLSGLETNVAARFWHNNRPDGCGPMAHRQNTAYYADYPRTIDPRFGERDFGAASEIPLGDCDYRVEGRFDITVSGTTAGFPAAVWQLSEDGRRVASGVLIDGYDGGPQDGVMSLWLPEDLVLSSGDANLELFDVISAAGSYVVDEGEPVDAATYPAQGDVGPDPRAFLNNPPCSCDCADRLGDDGAYEASESCDGQAHRRRNVVYELTVTGVTIDNSLNLLAKDPTPETVRFVVYPPADGGGDGQGGLKEFTRDID